MIKKSAVGQVQMSFGMIFSIILIIVFLAFAFYAIKFFLGIQKNATAGKFINDIQSDIDRIWRETESAEQQEYSLPQKVSSVCFVDFSFREGRGPNANIFRELNFAVLDNENMVFYPVGSSDMESAKIKKIDLGSITGSENPYCIEGSRGKVRMTLSKSYGEALVKIAR